jgi:hypothetical protein
MDFIQEVCKGLDIKSRMNFGRAQFGLVTSWTRRLDQNDWCETLIFYDHSSRHYSPQRLEIEDIRRLLSSSLVMFILFGYLHLVYL